MSSFLLSLAIATGVSTILLWLLTEPISGVSVSIGTAFGVSILAQMIIVLISFGLDFVLLNHLGLAVILAVGLGMYFQALLLQIATRATGERLPTQNAYLLPLVVVLADFFVVSHLVEQI